MPKSILSYRRDSDKLLVSTEHGDVLYVGIVERSSQVPRCHPLERSDESFCSRKDRGEGGLRGAGAAAEGAAGHARAGTNRHFTESSSRGMDAAAGSVRHLVSNPARTGVTVLIVLRRHALPGTEHGSRRTVLFFLTTSVTLRRSDRTRSRA